MSDLYFWGVIWMSANLCCLLAFLPGSNIMLSSLDCIRCIPVFSIILIPCIFSIYIADTISSIMGWE